ncbi:MAG: 50S ribosomal protein L6, partial [Acidimicrobiales bacterium]|nr:50S ribosomal protein L6 [Acidimicrobiales bacterium]
MSRIGSSPIPIPSGVDVSVSGQQVTVKGSKGELSMRLPGKITASVEDETVTVVRPDDETENKAMHGLGRSLVANMVVGVSEGFQKKLEIVGVGYRATAKGKD